MQYIPHLIKDTTPKLAPYTMTYLRTIKNPQPFTKVEDFYKKKGIFPNLSITCLDHD